MAITLSTAYLRELRKGVNQPCVIFETALDSGTVKWGTHDGGFADVRPIITNISNLQNKIDIKKGFSNRGQITFTIGGRDNFKTLVQTEYLKNRRVTRKEGFIADGYTYADYAPTYTGLITDWSRKGDEFTITVADDLSAKGSIKLPAETTSGPAEQVISFCQESSSTPGTPGLNGPAGMNPVDIMQYIINHSTLLNISTVYYDSTRFDTEQANWLAGWRFCRVLTEPIEANKLLNELQEETNSFIIHDGEKISYKVFAPPLPGQTVQEWTDNNHILLDSMSVESGYKDNFYNRVVIYYDYNEEGGDSEENFESAVIAIDADSQSTAQWDEVKTRVIKSKWIRSITWEQMTGFATAGTNSHIKVYHISKNNGTGEGQLKFIYSSVSTSSGLREHTLQWSAPGSVPGASFGDAVTISKDGKYQIFDSDKTKWVRVAVSYDNLANIASTASRTITDPTTISDLGGSLHAASLADKILSRNRDPRTNIKFKIDLNNVAWNSEFIKPTDLKDITTDEAFEFGESTWNKERMILTSVRPDVMSGSVEIEAIETKMYKNYGFIAPAGYPDYSSASTAQRQYAFIGNSSNEVGSSADDGYYIW